VTTFETIALFVLLLVVALRGRHAITKARLGHRTVKLDKDK